MLCVRIKDQDKSVTVPVIIMIAMVSILVEHVVQVRYDVISSFHFSFKVPIGLISISLEPHKCAQI